MKKRWKKIRDCAGKRVELVKEEKKYFYLKKKQPKFVLKKCVLFCVLAMSTTIQKYGIRDNSKITVISVLFNGN